MFIDMLHHPEFDKFDMTSLRTGLQLKVFHFLADRSSRNGIVGLLSCLTVLILKTICKCFQLAQSFYVYFLHSSAALFYVLFKKCQTRANGAKANTVESCMGGGGGGT